MNAPDTREEGEDGTAPAGSHGGRDALTLRLLGSFFILFGVLVWVALFWEQPVEGRVVNFFAGLALLVAGGVGILLGRRAGRSAGDE